MKLISYNIGIKIDNSEKVAQFLKEQDADILCLQEVIRHFDDTAFRQYRSKKVIDEALKDIYPHTFFGPQWISKHLELRGNRQRDFGGYVEQGNYFLSKYPILSAENRHYLYTYRLESDHTKFAETDHPRSVAITTVDIQGRKLTLMNIHGCWSKGKKDTEFSLKQSMYLLDIAKDISDPLLLVGDFNVAPKTKSIRMLSEVFENMIETFQISSTLPNSRGNLETAMLVDYIFSNEKITPRGLQVPQIEISDHLPLIFDFDLK